MILSILILQTKLIELSTILHIFSEKKTSILLSNDRAYIYFNALSTNRKTSLRLSGFTKYPLKPSFFIRSAMLWFV